jgi:hypothetical protein
MLVSPIILIKFGFIRVLFIKEYYLFITESRWSLRSRSPSVNTRACKYANARPSKTNSATKQTYAILESFGLPPKRFTVPISPSTATVKS